MNPKGLNLVLIIIGISIIVYSFTMPAYTNSEWKEKLDREAEQKLEQINDTEDFGEVYNKKLEKIKTPKNEIANIGLGFIFLGSALAYFFYLLKIKKWKDLLKVKTFGDRTQLWTSSVLFLVLYLPMLIIHSIIDEIREDRHEAYRMVFMDGGGVIGGIIFLFLFGALILPFVLGCKFPTQMFIKPKTYTTITLSIEVFWGFWIILDAVFTLVLIFVGEFSLIPISLLFLYTLASLRTGYINRFATQTEIIKA